MSAPAPLASAPAPAAVVVAAGRQCENCGNAVTQRYCGACGQRLEAPVHSLWHFSRIATEDLTHADSRVWRTLWALLFKPGYLTSEFLAGHRARYLPPVRLYLVISVAFFLVASAVNPRLAVVQFDPDKVADTRVTSLERPEDRPGPQSKASETPEQRIDRVCPGENYTGPGIASVLPRFRQGCHKTIADWTTAASCRRSSCTTWRAPCSFSCRCWRAS